MAMMLHKAYKFRIYPTEAQKFIFSKIFGGCRFVYNKALEYKKNLYDKQNKRLTKYYLINYGCQVLKMENEWLREIDSLALISSIEDVDFSYQMYFKGAAGFPNFKTKRDNKQSYRTKFNNGNIKIKNRQIKIPKVGWIKLNQHRELPINGQIATATITKTASKKYFVCLMVKYEKCIEAVTPKTFIGLDFSMHELFVDSNGDNPNFPHYYRKAQKRIAKEKRKLDLMKFQSNNWEKQRIKLAKITEKVTHSRADFLHKRSRQITNSYDCVCIEDLNMRRLSKALNFGKSVNDNAWGTFVKMLTYKLAEQGKQLVKVDKFFPSSQICSKCGCIHKITKHLKVRKWICPDCGSLNIRDMNAAINIRNEGMRLIGA